MSKRRVSLVKCLSEVCSSYSKPESFRIILPLLRNLSTAAEPSYFQRPTEHNDENSFENHRNHNVYYGESQKPVYFQQKPNWQIPDKPIGGNTRGSYGGSCMEDSPRLNPNANYGENPRNVFSGGNYGQAYEGSGGVYQDTFGGKYHQNSSERGNPKFDGYSRVQSDELQPNPSVVNVNTSKGFQESHNGIYQNQNKVYGNNPRSEYYNNDAVGHGNHSERFGNYDRDFQQNPRAVQHHWNGFNGGNGHLQNQHEAYCDYPAEVRQNRDAGQYQQHQSPSAGQYQHNQNNGEYEQNRNYGQYQQHQSPSSGQYQHNQNNREYGRYPNESPQVPEGEVIESSKAISNEGSLEELDGFCEEGKVNQAVEILGLLEKQSVPVDLVRCFRLLEACGDAKSLQDAKSVHEYITRLMSPLEVSTYDRIIETYSKCGSMADATIVFEQMPERNLTSWNTMIKGFVKNGLGEEAIDLFTEFKKTGLKPDDQIFVTIFSACSVVGDADEGILHFQSMKQEFGMIPSLEHYEGIVDMLGNSGYIDEALEFIEKMPLEPDVGIWEKLMNLCRIHGNVELGDRCAEIINQHDPSRLTEQSKQGFATAQEPDIAKDKENKRMESETLLQVRSRIHEYRAGDKSDPQSDRIYAQLRHLREQMKESGYVPQTRFVLHDIDQESKEEALLSHSERLAVSYGLFSSAARSPIRVIKNLRVCVDCHNALKIISKIVGRELIMRDAKRFHHFKDGVCTCKDYW